MNGEEEAVEAALRKLERDERVRDGLAAREKELDEAVANREEVATTMVMKKKTGPSRKLDAAVADGFELLGLDDDDDDGTESYVDVGGGLVVKDDDDDDGGWIRLDDDDIENRNPSRLFCFCG